jgi:hypothetical protein
MALSFSDVELQDFLNCRSGQCTVQLSTEEIATIPANGSLQTEVGKAEVANAYRKILLDRLLAYQKGGTAALASYVGSPEPQNLMDNLQEHLYKFPYLHAYFPRVEKMILDYPAYRDPGLEILLLVARSSGNKTGDHRTALIILSVRTMSLLTNLSTIIILSSWNHQFD